MVGSALSGNSFYRFDPVLERGNGDIGLDTFLYGEEPRDGCGLSFQTLIECLVSPGG